MDNLPLWAHQQLGVARAKNLPWFAFLYEQGCGKTRTLLETLREKMRSERRYFRTLIFAPPVVVNVWVEEFKKYTKIPHGLIVPLVGSAKQRIKTFNEYAYDAEGFPHPIFFSANYESLLMPDLYAAFQKWQPEALVFDEAHRLKSHSAKRSKLAEKLANPKGLPKPLCYLLTGTPILNSPSDIFFPYLIMDGGETLGRNFFIFRARYFIDKNSGIPKARYWPNWQVRPGALEEINRLIFNYGMRVTKSECLDLPEEVIVPIQCGMSAQQIKAYSEMKKDFVTFIKDEAVTATLAITKALRLLQITSGFLPVPSAEEDVAHEFESTPKEDALRQLLMDLTPSAKVIVWAVWKHNYKTIRRICEELKIEFVEITGEVSRAKQDEAVRRFRDNDRVRVILGHPASAGLGISLVAASYSIFYSRNFSLEQWLQARARNHRGGTVTKTTHYNLFCPGTIDETVCGALSNKQAISDKILIKAILEEKDL